MPGATLYTRIHIHALLLPFITIIRNRSWPQPILSYLILCDTPTYNLPYPAQHYPTISHLKYGETPLHFAAKYRHNEVVRLLVLEKGADIGARAEVSNAACTICLCVMCTYNNNRSFVKPAVLFSSTKRIV